MKQLQKETEPEKFSPSIHAAHLSKPRENNQKTRNGEASELLLTKFAFPLSQEMSSAWSTVAETERLSQNGEVVELRTSETTSPDRHLVSNRSHNASNGED